MNSETVLRKYIKQCYKENKFPVLICDLPSRGVIYSKNSSFYKIGKAIVSRISGKTEEWGCDNFFLTNPYYINYLIEEHILYKDKISIDEMITADRDIIILQILITTYGKELSINKLTCKNCEKEFDPHDVEIEKYWRENLNIDPLETGKNIFKHKLGKDEIIFKIPTIEDEKDILDYEKEYDYNIGYYLSKILISFNEKTDIESMINNNEISLKQIQKIKKYIQSVIPYIKIRTTEIICPFCAKDNTIESHIGLELLPINKEHIRDYATGEYIFLTKKLHMNYAEIFNMPIENRKRIIKKEIDNMEKERESANNPVKNKSNNGQMKLL